MPSLLSDTYFWDLEESTVFPIPYPHEGSDNLREHYNSASNAITLARGGLPVSVRKQTQAGRWKIKYGVLSEADIESLKFFYEEKVFWVYPKGSINAGLKFQATWVGGFNARYIPTNKYSIEFTIAEVL